MASETSDQDNMSAMLDRAMTRFASKTGLAQEGLEMSDKKTDAKTAGYAKVVATRLSPKKAAGGEADVSGMGGNQLQTTEDRGDYDTQQQQVGKQDKETKDNAKDGTPELGSQQNTTRFDDKSYSNTGAGGSAKLSKKRALAAVLAIAEEDPKAAASFLRLADGFIKTTDDTDLGPPLGGEPASVSQGEEVEESTTPEVPAPEGPVEAPGAPAPSGDSSQVRLQDAIQERQESLDIDRQVVQELNKVMEQVASRALKTADEKAEKAKKEKDEKDKKEKAEKKAKEDKAEKDKKAAKTAADTHDKGDAKVPKEDVAGAGKVPHASTDVPSQTTQDGDPDYTLFEESKGKSESTPESASGQEMATSGDRDYVFSVKAESHMRQKLSKRAVSLRKNILLAVSRRAKKEGLTAAQAKQVLSLVLAKTSAGQEYARIRKVLGADPSQTPVADQTAQAKGDETTRYDKAQQGDTADDDISAGTEKVLESPETKTVVDEANRAGDKKHSQDIQGATVASLLSDIPRKGTESRIALFERVATVLATYGGKVAILGANAASAKARVTSLVSSIKVLVGSMKATLAQKVAAKEGPAFTKAVMSIRDNVMVGDALVLRAKDLSFVISAAGKSVTAASAKFERVTPAFKLACHMLAMRQLDMNELPKKVAEFVNMSMSEFKVAESMAADIGRKTAARKEGSNGATRSLPFVHTAGSAFGQNGAEDELTNIFE